MELVRGRERERSCEGVDQEKKEREGGEGGREEREGGRRGKGERRGRKREGGKKREKEGERAIVVQLLLVFSQFVISPTQQGML